VLDDMKLYARAVREAVREYGVLRSAVDAWHVLRFETKDEGGPVAWTKKVLSDVRRDDSGVGLKVAYLGFMYGTPYCVSAMLASTLPDPWFKKRDGKLREEKFAEKLSTEFPNRA